MSQKTDYSKERGKIGVYKGFDVIVVTRESYERSYRQKNVIYVICDWDMRMVLNGMVMGTLSPSGNVNEGQQYPYKEMEKKEEKVDYFKEYSKPVDEFFAALEREKRKEE